jgi:biopolymer transport protein ExbB
MKTSLKKPLIIGGALTLLGPLIGVTGTVIGMIGAFDDMGASAPAKPEELSAHIGTTLYSTAIGFTFGIIGAITLIICFFIWLSQRTPNPQTT